MIFSLKDYVLAKVNLVRAGCPAELSNRTENLSLTMPVVIAQNRQKYGYVAAAAYCPEAVVVAGGARRDELLEQGITASWAWMEPALLKPLKVKDEAVIGFDEVLTRLQQALMRRYYGETGPRPGQIWASVSAVWPFANRLSFQVNGVRYAQRYALHPVQREFSLVGTPESSDRVILANNKETMLPVQTGVRHAVAPPKGNNQSSTTGAQNSELVTMISRSWDNVQAAVNAYLYAVKNGQYKPMKPSFAPVILPDDGRFGKTLAANGIDLLDFVLWTAQAQKTMDRDELIHEHKRLVNVLKRGTPAQRTKEAKAQERELRGL